MSIATPEISVDDYLLALGTLVVAHSDMENWMKGFANTMTNQNETTGQILTSDLPSKALREKLISLYLHHEKEPAKAEAFRALIDRISDCTQDRNDMVHSVWFFMPLVKKDDPVRVKAAAKLKGFTVETKPVNVSEIKSLIDRINRATKELIHTIYHWEYEHPTPAQLRARKKLLVLAEGGKKIRPPK